MSNLPGGMVQVWMGKKEGKRQPKKRIIVPLTKHQLLKVLREGSREIPKKGVRVELDPGFVEELNIVLALVWDEDTTMEEYEALK